MEGLKKVLQKIPSDHPHVLFLAVDGKLNKFTEVGAAQEAHLSPFFYLLMKINSFEDQSTLSTMRRIMFNPLAYQAAENPPPMMDSVLEDLRVYMNNFFSDSPWVFLYEVINGAEKIGRVNPEWNMFIGENYPLITFVSLLADRLFRIPPFLVVQNIAEENDLTLSPYEFEARDFIVNWLTRPDPGYDEALAEAMDLEEEPSGESIGSRDSIDAEEDDDDDEDDSKGKGELE
jgi:hypothetical protein